MTERDNEMLVSLSFHPSGVLWTINIHIYICIYITHIFYVSFSQSSTKKTNQKKDQGREGGVLLDGEGLAEVTVGQTFSQKEEGGMHQSEKRAVQVEESSDCKSRQAEKSLFGSLRNNRKASGMEQHE